ncbi:natural cytotoxicity triggering receptor 3-like isoform X2 [Dendropsophus ebraccatus]|uniref:natural cytotoxicity triggering receptor 3-like isoform X2 n=1 Tax=Dendropsophus ebraccatus TaxID=150705 RepID=UPI003831CE52
MMSQVQVVLILGALEGCLSQMIQVFQDPVVYGYEGSDVTLPCTYNVSAAEDVTAGFYKWYRHLPRIGQVVSNSSKDFTGRIIREDTEVFIQTRSAKITIHKVNITHTGMYYCEVSFLHHNERISGLGDGTLLNVTNFSDILEIGIMNSYVIVVRMALGILALLAVLALCCVHFEYIGMQKNEE